MSTISTPMLEVKKNNLAELLNQCAIPVLVDFWAPWCGPCQQLTPVLQELSKIFDGKVQIIKVNVDENEEVARTYSIHKIPTLLVFDREKQLIDTLQGYATLNKLQSTLTAHFAIANT